MTRKKRPSTSEPGDLREFARLLKQGPSPLMERQRGRRTLYVPMRPEDEGLTQRQLRELDDAYKYEQINREIRERKLTRRRQPGRGPAFPKH